jgi:glycosyltransferase involved in cell wall biosynthesis
LGDPSPAAGVPVPILFLDHTAKMGGGEIALLRLVTALDRARYQPNVLLFADGPLRTELADAGIPVRVLTLDESVGDVRKDSLGIGSLVNPKRLTKSLRFVRRLAREIRASGAAVVHTNSLKSDLLGGLAARVAGVPVIWHVRDRIATDYLPGPVVAMFRQAAAVVPRLVIANSRSTLETVGRVARAGPDRARVVHDGTLIDVPQGTDAPNAPAVVGMVGRLTRWKGQHVFLDAAARVRRQFHQTRFELIGSAMFGEADYEQQLRTRAAQPDLAGSVDFLGFRSDVPERMAALDVLVHASTTGEPFGQVVIEGMAAARPVIATAGGGVPELIVDGDSGLLVPMNDAPALALAIERLLADPALRQRLARGGRARVVERFTTDRTARGVEAAYDVVLGRNASAA